ncbi:MAG: peptide chain release factor N(5)-glutamine methyltransferase [Alphaproteobacteria bacterium]|nr:peptide chain release factor N(5)-glutamine methyltransferase [Alphaproteobacteria bacterium]
MTLNQAFDILTKASDAHIARIITEKFKKLSRLQVMHMAKLLRKGMPVAKVIHSKWFYGLEFYTNKHTLDPRPDTETLVEAVIKDNSNNLKAKSILDLGTGTGCIICALCKNIDNVTGTAIDKSRKALRVAKHNVKTLGLANKIKLKHSSFEKFKPKQKFDIIVSNPPYIRYGDPQVNKFAKFDPKMALYAKENGTYAYATIAKNAKLWLKPEGKLYVEIGAGQAHNITTIFTYNGWHFERVETDLAGINRVLVFSL